MDNDDLYRKFASIPKGLIIAPAGYGKTHTIVESLIFSEGRQLVLTHTNAGVASIKEKIRKHNPPIPTWRYNIETIDGYVQKYVLAFCFKEIIPDQKDRKEYYSFLRERAASLFNNKLVSSVINSTYSGLYVDEYQDCTKSQHKLIECLSKVLPTHIIADPLQGIFDFDGQLVDFDKDLVDFSIVGKLDRPWRWEKTNVALGLSLSKIRQDIESGKQINLLDLSNSAEIKIRDSSQYSYLENAKYLYNEVSKIIDNSNQLLIIHPVSSRIEARLTFCKQFSGRVSVIESVDDNDFYEYSQKIDNLVKSNDLYADLLLILKGEPSTRKKSKTKTRKRTLLTGLSFLKDGKPPSGKTSMAHCFTELLSNFDFIKLRSLLVILYKTTGVNCYRKELFWDLARSLSIAGTDDVSVLNAMESVRNKKRGQCKKNYGKTIGTTLLTKGLEFDTVVVLDAHKFVDSKNLYVALTRASTKLIVFSDNGTLGPFNAFDKNVVSVVKVNR